MFRVWGRIFKENKLIKDATVCIPGNTNRTRKVFASMDEICADLDLCHPVWLEKNINEFKRLARTRFYNESFVEPIDFDYLDFYVIEEDD